MRGCDFDTPVVRRGTGSYKWDSAPDGEVLPLWVADMDFRTAPAVIEALRRRVEHGIFGYTRVPDDYYEALGEWFDRRHGWHIEREEVIYTSGVVPALSAVIKALTEPGDKVLALTPVYNCFYSSIRNNGCGTEASRLIRAGESYEVDFDDMERRAADPRVKLFLLCNPHNPVGRVWSREELRRMGDICLRHGVRVVADEIHCELVFPGFRYTPYASLGGDYAAQCVVCLSPSKAFNIAGLQIANIVAADPEVRRKIDRAININEVCDVNPFGPEALIAAYRHGGEWLDSLVEYLHGNYLMLREHFAARLPRFPVTALEGTYLAWVDASATGLDSGQVEERLLQRNKVWVNAGTMYGPGGEGFIRINMATQRTRLAEGLERIGQGLAELL